MIYLDANAKKVLDIWFSGDILPSILEGKISPSTRTTLIDNLLDLHNQAVSGELDDWVDIPQESLALIILLLHFPRVLYSNLSFKEEAILISLHAIKFKYDYKIINKNHRFFLYYPLLLSSDEEHKKIAIEKFANISKDALAIAKNILLVQK